MVNDSESVPQDEDDGTLDPFELVKKQMLITLDDVEYPCTSWESTAQGQRLVITWSKGLAKGMNHHQYEPEGYLVAQHIDVTQYPYMRMRPAYQAVEAIAALDTAFPIYTFRHKGPTKDFLYVLNATGIFKLLLNANGTMTLQDSKSVSGGVAGRPALWQGKWYVPMGASGLAQRLDTTNDSGGDSWSTMDGTQIKATHYLSGMIEDGVRKLTRSLGADVYVTSTTDNTIWGSAFPVGDSSNDVTDLLLWQGEAAVCKPDGVYKFSLEATSEAFPIFQLEQRFSVSTVGTDTYLGSRSTVHGALLYYAHRNLTRALPGGQTITVGPDSDPNRMHFTYDSFTMFTAAGRWNSVEAWGRNIYASFGTQVFHGEIQENGLIKWFGALFDPGKECTISIEEGDSGAGVGPTLWIFDTDNAYRVLLDGDGSPRTTLGGSARGKANESGLLVLPSLHMGEEIGQDLSDVRKQLRRVGVVVEGGTRSNISIALNVFRDGTTVKQNIGTVVASQADGLYEASPTVGTDDLFHWIMYYIKFDAAQAYDPTDNKDPRLRSWFIEAVTPMIYEAVIELSPGLTGTSNSPEGARKLIRDVTQKRIAIREPGLTDTFLGYVRKIREETFKTEPPHSRLGIRLTLEIERFDWPA